MTTSITALQAARAYLDALPVDGGDNLVFTDAKGQQQLVQRALILEAVLRSIDASGSDDPVVFGPFVPPMVDHLQRQLIERAVNR